VGLPGSGEPGDDVAVSLRFADGSLAAIAYGSVLPTAGKEWIEVTSSRHRVVIDDFRRAESDGKVIWKGRQDKGHRACVAAFRQAVGGGAAMPTDTLLDTMAATIQAAARACEA
jgi:predicted dehydrogenase